MKYKSYRKTTKCNIYGGKMANTPHCVNKHIFYLQRYFMKSPFLSAVIENMRLKFYLEKTSKFTFIG